MLTRENIHNNVLSIIAEQLNMPVEKIKENSTFDELGADSLDRVEIVMKLEEQFNIEISDTEIEKVKTVGDVINYIEQLSHNK